MEQLKKFESTYHVVQGALREKELFRDGGFSGPVSLAEALRTDMTSLPDASSRVGQPSTAWWWYTEVNPPLFPLPSFKALQDFFRPLTGSDMRSLLPKEDELDPWKDPAFRMPPVGTPDGRRTLTEFWEGLGYETLRKERRSGRLAEKKAFHTGFDIPSAPSDEWLGLPKEFLKDKKNLVEICKDSEIVAKLDSLMEDLKDTGDTAELPAAPVERFSQMHPLTEMLLDSERDVFSGNCLAIGPDDEVSAEILKLQETLLQQMVTNRKLARRLCKSALSSCKFDRKKATRKDKLEKEIQKCQKVVEAHEKKKKDAIKKEASPENEPQMKPEPKPETEQKPTTEPQTTPVAVTVPDPVTKVEAVPAKRCSEVCEICGTCSDTEEMLTCEHCGIHVHAQCYEPGATVEDGLWRCLPCRIYHERERDLQLKSTGLKSGGALSADCKACPNRGGAYERTADSKKLIHTVCRLALEEAPLRATAASKRCGACGKAKGRVFRCLAPGCDGLIHASCAKKFGRVDIQRPAGDTSLRLLALRCAVCAAGPALKEETTERETQTPLVIDKRSRGPSVADASSSRSEEISDEKAGSGRGPTKKRGKRRKLATTPSKDTLKHRGRPKTVHKHRKRPKRESTPEDVSVSEEPESRRMTRSMK